MNRDQALVQACLQQDRTAQRTLYEQYGGKLFAITLRYMKNREEAEDVLQEVWIRIFSHLDSFRFDCPLEAWLKRIAINTAIRALQKQPQWKNFLDTDGLEISTHHEMSALDLLSVEELRSLIQQLPDGCQTIFNLYAVEGYKHHEIATLLGITEGTSKSQYSRAKALLQKEIKSISN